MGRPFTDRWGVPVQAASEQGVVLLDEAIEALAALAGNPVAGAEDAATANDELLLGHIYRAYLSLYGTSAQGVASAEGILKRLEGVGERAGEREALHLQAARSWASGEWEAVASGRATFVRVVASSWRRFVDQTYRYCRISIGRLSWLVVTSVNVKPWLADRQPSVAAGCSS